MAWSKAASALNHPHVATIYEIGEAEGVNFIAMEYVEGQTLAAKISGHPLKVNEIVEIGSQIADAIDEAHGKGITHRDIKPANVMITPRGQVKVLDFGSNRGGFLNVWGIRFDPTQGKPVGEPFRVTSFENPGRMIPDDMYYVDLGIAANRLVLPIMEVSGSIWILENVDR
jgi:serine/threonine protein kinase